MPRTPALPRRPALFLASLLAAGCATQPQFLSGAEIRLALADHTAVLPGGFEEYYAPDGTLRGRSEGEPYQGTWEIKDDAFCTALGGDPPVCSRVSRAGRGLMWSMDGEKRPNRVDLIMPGNPRNL